MAFCGRVTAILDDVTSTGPSSWSTTIRRMRPGRLSRRLRESSPASVAIDSMVITAIYAIRAGLERCDADWVVVMDGDLQELPEAIPALYQRAQSGDDLVLARKRLRRQPLVRRVLAAAYFRALNVLSRLHHEPGVGNFRLLSRANVDWILEHGVNSWLFGLTGDPTRPKAIVDVDYAPRFAGTTSYRWSRRSTWPLKDRVWLVWCSGGLGPATSTSLSRGLTPNQPIPRRWRSHHVPETRRCRQARATRAVCSVRRRLRRDAHQGGLDVLMGREAVRERPDLLLTRAARRVP